MVQNIVTNFVGNARLPKRAWQDHTHFFYLEKYYEKTDGYFSMIPFASSRLWYKIFLKILSSMISHLKGRGRTTPIFR